MSSHANIVVSGDPKGHFTEGYITGALKPGTMVIMTAAVEPINGRFTYKAWDGAADGERDEVIILLADFMQGKTKTDAYVSGDRCFLYHPVAGDEIQVLCRNLTSSGSGSGTTDAFAIGDKLIVKDTFGTFIKTTGSPESEPFKVIETVAALTADTLVLCRYTGV